MKHWQRHWSARPLSYVLSIAIAWPSILFCLLGAQPAQAQERSGQLSWAVMDFSNRSGYGGDEIGRLGSDAFVVELGKSNKYDVLPRHDVDNEIKTEGLTTPLDTIGLQKVGRALGVDAIATGDVIGISFTGSPRQATASIVIRVTDPTTGELVNGALAQGRSNPRAIPSQDDDALVTEALGNAAFAAVRQITRFTLPTATVLNNEDANTVLLNRGTRDGLYDGLKMVVTRDGQEMGRIVVGQAYADESDAFVTDRGLGIRPQDRARAIYQLPAYSVDHGVIRTSETNDVSSDGSSPQGGHRSPFSGIGGILLAVLAGVLLLTLVHKGSSTGTLAGAQVGKPSAVEGRADVIGGPGDYPGEDPLLPGEDGITTVGTFDPTAAQWVPISVAITATVGNINAADFYAYNVYRDDFPPNLANGVVGVATTTTTGGTGTAGINNFGQVPILTEYTQGPLLVYDDGSEKIISASKPISSLSTSTTTSTTAGTAGLETVTSGGLPVPETGIEAVGNRYHYYIEGVWFQAITLNQTTTATTTTTTTTNTTGGVTSGGAASYELTARAQTNFITYLEPVLLNNNLPSVAGSSFVGSTSLENVNVTVPSVRGGDLYELQFSPNSSFPSGQTTNDTSYTPGLPSGNRSGSPLTPRQETPISFNLQGASAPGAIYKNQSTIYLRIGAKDSNSQANPYVFSDPVTIPFNS